MEHKLLKKDDGGIDLVIASEVISKRLPDKRDIGTCRLVCKAWRSIISTAMFYREYRENHPVTIDDYKLVAFDESDVVFPFRTFSLDESIPPLPPFPNRYYPEICIIASLDGLVLAAFVPDKSLIDVRLFLLNPLTRKCKDLPPVPGFHIFFVADPIGFYIHHPSSSDDDYDYRLVCVCRERGSGPLGAFVYSHRLDSWTRIKFEYGSGPDELFSNPKDLNYSWSPPTSFGQCLYFEVTILLDIHSAYSRILCFDVETEEFRDIPLPVPQNAATSFLTSLFVLDGRLHLHVFHKTSDGQQHVDVWKMKKNDDDDGGGDWVKVRAFITTEARQLICTKSTGNWVAVLDERENSFKKVNTEDFKKRYRDFVSASSGYRLSRGIYDQSFVDPCLFDDDDDEDDDDDDHDDEDDDDGGDR